MKKLWYLLVVLLLLCSCEKNTVKTYTVTDETGIKKIVSYGTVICDEIIYAEIPDNSKIISSCKLGERVDCGQTLVEYQHNGISKKINATNNGIICQPKDKIKGIYYYNMDNVTVATEIPETEIRHIEIGNEVNLIGEGLAKNKYNGTVIQISPSAKKEQNGTFVECKIKLNNPDKSIMPGFSIRIEREIELKNSVKIPIEAINYDKNGCYVIIIKNERSAKKYIENILFNDGQYAVCEGINYNETLKIKE